MGTVTANFGEHDSQIYDTASHCISILEAFGRICILILAFYVCPIDLRTLNRYVFGYGHEHGRRRWG